MAPTLPRDVGARPSKPSRSPSSLGWRIDVEFAAIARFESGAERASIPRVTSKADLGGNDLRLEKFLPSGYDCGKERSMSKTPAEPTNLVLEQLRVMRAETNARFDQMDVKLEALDARVGRVEKELRGLKLNTIAEIYKANLTVASFADHERRIQELERKSS